MHVNKYPIKIYSSIILLVVLYRCETWLLTLREVHRLRAFGPKRYKVIREWRKLHNGELSVWDFGGEA
jgi:hypothetical protein